MTIKGRLLKVWRKDSAEKIAEKTVSKVEDIDNIEKAKAILLQALEENPNMIESLLVELGRKIDESDKAPNELLDEVAVEITSRDSIPNSVITNKQVIENMTDEGKRQLIENDYIGLKAQKKVVKQIENPEIKKAVAQIVENREEKRKIEKDQVSIQELNLIYKNCAKLSELIIVDKIDALNLNRENPQIQKLLWQIVAKKMADNFLKYRGTTIPTLARIISVSEMFEINMPELVQHEWDNMSKAKKNSSDNFIYDKNFLKMQLLEYIAKEAREGYVELGRFNIPRSLQMQTLLPEEKEKFIKMLGRMSKIDRLDVDTQIRGSMGVKARIEGIEKYLLDMPEEERNRRISFFERIQTESRLMESIELMEKIGLFDEFKNISITDERKLLISLKSMMQDRKNREKIEDKPKTFNDEGEGR